jgi:hypothetical protein
VYYGLVAIARVARAELRAVLVARSQAAAAGTGAGRPGAHATPY